MNDSQNDKVKVICWINGKEKDHAFTLEITPSINSMKRLKEAIIYEKNYNKSYIDRMIIYNYKGIEIDDLDIPYFTQGQILYLSLDGGKFNIYNYVDEYEFIKTIKTGGYAEVYLAKHAITNELISVKKTDLHNFLTEELYGISREAVYLSTLIHKNIIKIRNSYTHNNFLYNVMDYAEGGELSQLLIDETPIPEDRIKDLFYQMHNAVKFIHSKNIIHRDLKPNNILFLDKEQTHVVIIDFGISGICNGMSREVIKAGTLRYVPPELASGEAYSCSPKIDIWALGVILYLMHFKMFPFEGNDNVVLDKIVNDPIVFPAKVKIRKSLVPLIEGMFQKNPNRRIDISDTLFDAWYNDESDDFITYAQEKEMNSNVTFKSGLFANQNKSNIKPIKKVNKLSSSKDNKTQHVKSNMINNTFNSSIESNLKGKTKANTNESPIKNRAKITNIKKTSI